MTPPESQDGPGGKRPRRGNNDDHLFKEPDPAHGAAPANDQNTGASDESNQQARRPVQDSPPVADSPAADAVDPDDDEELLEGMTEIADEETIAAARQRLDEATTAWMSATSAFEKADEELAKLDPRHYASAESIRKAEEAKATAEEQAAKNRESRINGLVEKAGEEEEAKRRFRQQNGLYRPEDPGQLLAPSLADMLAEPDESEEWRINGFLAREGRGVIAAARKAGKTTLVLNVVRSLMSGAPVFDHFEVEPVAADRSVVVLDLEMSRRKSRQWYRDGGVQHPDRVHIVNLRGRLGAFNLTDPELMAAWVRHLKEVRCEVLVLDCLRPWLDSMGLDENKQTGQAFVLFSELLDRAGVGEALVMHHTGHNVERQRGESRIGDWPDTLATIVPDDPEDPKAKRYLHAIGRDVAVDEGLLEFHEVTRRLVFHPGQSRKTVNRAERSTKSKDELETLAAALVETVRTTETPLTKTALCTRHGDGLARQAFELAIADGRLAPNPDPDTKVSGHPSLMVGPGVPPPGTTTKAVGQRRGKAAVVSIDSRRSKKDKPTDGGD